MIQLYIRLILLILIPVTVFSQNKSFYTINGDIKGLREGEKVIIKLMGKGWEGRRIDSAYVKAGKFVLKGNVPEGPRIIHLFSENHIYKPCAMLIDNGEQIIIEGSDINKMPFGNIRKFLKINNSQTDLDLSKLQSNFRLYVLFINELNEYIDHITDSISYDAKMIGALIGSKKSFNKMFFRALLEIFPIQNKALPCLLYNLGSSVPRIHDSLLNNIYKGLDNELKGSFYGKLLKENLPLLIGQHFPEFNLPDANGKMLSQDQITSKNKITLIHFWSSNSKGFETAQNQLSTYFNSYSKKGLGIVGISSDTNMKKWKIAIQDIPWHNVSDLKGSEGVIENKYLEIGNSSDPNLTNVLVDSNGIILEWGVSNKELKWYLDNYLNK